MKPTRRRALVVDDDRAMVKTLSDVLALKGWDVAKAYDGSAAVDAVAREKFDIVLMDVKMPGMDGVTAFNAMKSANPDIRVVLMTAYAAQQQLIEAERAGVLVVPKPIDVQQLLDLLTGRLERKQPVLLIDTDVAFLKTLSDVLQLRGFDTVVAATLDEALRLMKESRPAAVLLHIHLGSANPLDAVGAVHQGSPAAALVIYSGRPGAAERACRALPPEWIHACLQKPFAIEKVTEMLDAVRIS